MGGEFLDRWPLKVMVWRSRVEGGRGGRRICGRESAVLAPSLLAALSAGRGTGSAGGDVLVGEGELGERAGAR